MKKMKIDMKKIICICGVGALLTSLTGCLKDDPLNDFDSTAKAIVELPYHGLEGFASDAVLTAGRTDTIEEDLVVNVASVYPLSTDVNFTVAVDDALRGQYNAQGGVQYEQLPDSTFSFTETTGTIKAGSRLDTLHISFYPGKVDPAINYMLPIKITDASGQTISGNFGAVYYHMIGNPLAGNYIWDFKRWPNAIGPASGPPDANSFTDVATFLPDDPTTVEAPSGYYTQKNYVITFDNNNGTLSNFKVVPSAAMLADFEAGGITITEAPSFVIADPVAKHFQIKMIVFNGTASRYCLDDFTPQ
jgi:hypothetical protein